MDSTTRQSAGRVGLAVLIVLTAWVFATAIRVEMLNERAGGVLPLDPVVPGEGNQKWRVGSQRTAERGMRAQFMLERGLPYDPDAAAAMELTASEQAELEQYLRRTRDNSRLRRLVYGPGMLQYLLVPAGMILAVVLWPKRPMGWRLLLSFCLVCCATAGGFALYREYAQAMLR